MRPSRTHFERSPAEALIALYFALSLGRELPPASSARQTPEATLEPSVTDDWDVERETRLGLSLADRVTPPSRQPPDMETRIREGVARIVREQDDALGLGQPEVSGVARIVSDVARETGAYHGSRAVFEITLAANGTPLSVTRDTESWRNRAWAPTIDAILERLRESPVHMGPAAARAGAVVEVAVEVLHVYPHGTDWQFKFTDCSDVPKIEHTDEHGRPLLATFGFGLRFDIGSWGAKKQLVVRTRATRRLPDFENAPDLDGR